MTTRKPVNRWVGCILHQLLSIRCNLMKFEIDDSGSTQNTAVTCTEKCLRIKVHFFEIHARYNFVRLKLLPKGYLRSKLRWTACHGKTMQRSVSYI